MSSLSTLLAPFWDGILVGLFVTAPIGPMAVLCMQRTIAQGVMMGVSTGLAAATMALIYGALAVIGLGTLAPWLTPGGHAISGLRGLLLLRSALCTVLRTGVPETCAEATAVPTQRAAFGSALLISATNPVSMMSTVALLAPLRAAGPLSTTAACLVLAGIFIAACGWWAGFIAAVAFLRTRLHPAVLGLVTRTAGVLLCLYAAVALVRSVEWHRLPL